MRRSCCQEAGTRPRCQEWKTQQLKAGRESSKQSETAEPWGSGNGQERWLEMTGEEPLEQGAQLAYRGPRVGRRNGGRDGGGV